MHPNWHQEQRKGWKSVEMSHTPISVFTNLSSPTLQKWASSTWSWVKSSTESALQATRWPTTNYKLLFSVIFYVSVSCAWLDPILFYLFTLLIWSLFGRSAKSPCGGSHRRERAPLVCKCSVFPVFCLLCGRLHVSWCLWCGTVLMYCMASFVSLGLIAIVLCAWSTLLWSSRSTERTSSYST